jgi:DNA-binding transcriptional ArsR family regulator
MTPAMQFAALADETRCALIDMLRERPRAVHELAAAFPISRPAISRHLRLLREADLIAEERSGRENVYSLRRERLRMLRAWLDKHWTGRLDGLKQLAEATAPKQEEMEF